MKTILITGLIGAGKSSISEQFQIMFGIPVIHTDDVARYVMRREHVNRTMCDVIGYPFHAGMEIPRSVRMDAYFNRPDVGRTLNAIIHPLVESEIQRILFDCKRGCDHPYVLVEVPHMKHSINRFFNTSFADGVISVFAPVEQVTERVLRRSQHSVDQINAMISSQTDQDERDLLLRDTFGDQYWSIFNGDSASHEQLENQVSFCHDNIIGAR